MTTRAVLLLLLAACATHPIAQAPCPCSAAASPELYPSGAAAKLGWLGHRWAAASGDTMAWFAMGHAMMGVTFFTGNGPHSPSEFTMGIVIDDDDDRRSFIFSARGEAAVEFAGAASADVVDVKADREFPSAIQMRHRSSYIEVIRAHRKGGGDGPTRDEFERQRIGDDASLLEADTDLAAVIDHGGDCVGLWAAEGHAWEGDKRIAPPALCEALAQTTFHPLHSAIGSGKDLGITVGRWSARRGLAAGSYLRIWRVQDSGEWAAVFQHVVLDP